MAAQSQEANGRRYEGYTDYQSQSERIATAIDRAVAEYARLQRAHAEQAKISSDEAAEASRHILAAALRLLPELRDQRAAESVFDEIVVRWTDDEPKDDDIDPEELRPQGMSRPMLDVFMGEQLHRSCPEYLQDFVEDIRTAGWELGYLQAGRHSEKNEEWTEADVPGLFD